MPRATKLIDTALERAAALLPGGEVRPGPKKGRRVLSYTRPGGRRVEVEGRTAHVLYSAVLAATADPARGGLGVSMDQVRAAVAFRTDELYRAGVKSHEESLLRALGR